MKSDLRVAKEHLAGHTICLCRDGNCLVDDKRGIAPMMELLAAGVDLTGYSVADLVVGRAAAFLFVKGGICAVFAKTLSVFGKEVLDSHGIYCEYETLTEQIVNRDGTGICPMEKATLSCTDAEEAYACLRRTLAAMR